MSTKIINTQNQDQEAVIIVQFDNGDLDALREIKKKWNFKDLESVLRFGLAVLTISENGRLFHEKADGKSLRFEPMEDLIEKKEFALKN